MLLRRVRLLLLLLQLSTAGHVHMPAAAVAEWVPGV